MTRRPKGFTLSRTLSSTLPSDEIMKSARRLGTIALLVLVLVLGAASRGAEGAKRGTSRALIVAGIPGDAEHEARFAEVVRGWRAWLTGPLGFDPAEVGVLGGPGDAGSKGPATREALGRAVADMKLATRPDDRVWVFWLGHANYDGAHMRLHLPGPDLSDEEFAALFQGLGCDEQVFWMTSAGSGWLVRPLAAKGRITIAATERDQEFNETEFPRALAEVAAGPLAKLDTDGDGRVSVLEVYLATVARTAARFASNQRIPTEHAQIDDNGDGQGAELTGPTGPKARDGLTAALTFLNGR